MSADNENRDSTPPAEELFSAVVPGLPIAWDSTMLGLLKECPRKFQYIILEGHQSNAFAAHLEFGIAYHKALETFDKVKAEGASHVEAQVAMVSFCLNYGTRDEHGRFVPYDTAYTREPAKTRETLLRSVLWYTEHFKNDPAQTMILADGTPAVELSFKVDTDLITPDGKPYLLCGHLDRVVVSDGHNYIADRKTTKSAITGRYWAQYTPNNQMSLYYLAGQLVLNKPIKGLMIDAVELGVTYARFQRHTILRTPGQQDEWLRDTYAWIGLAQQFATDGHWPMNDKSCGNYGGCEFRSICGKDPKVRASFIKHEGYHRRQWNPLISR